MAIGTGNAGVKEGAIVGTAGTATVATHRAVRTYQFALQVYNRLKDAVEFYDKLEDLLDDSDFADNLRTTLREGFLGNVMVQILNGLVDAVPYAEKDLTVKIPGKIADRLADIWEMAVGFLQTHIAEFIGELGTAMIVDSLGFDPPDEHN